LVPSSAFTNFAKKGELVKAPDNVLSLWQYRQLKGTAIRCAHNYFYAVLAHGQQGTQRNPCRDGKTAPLAALVFWNLKLRK